MHYYKRNIGDYHKKAGRLTMLEHGAYTLLMDACYDREIFPTKEQAIDWCWARSPEEIKAVEFVLQKFFTESGGIYEQSNIKETVSQYHETAERNKQIALEREENRRIARARIVNDKARSVHEAPPNHKPLTTNQEPLTNKQKPLVKKDNSQQADKFTPPTVNQVDEYMQSICKGSFDEAEKFVNFYESKGWLVGKVKMKSWQASVRNWTKDSSPGHSKQSGFSVDKARAQIGSFLND